MPLEHCIYTDVEGEGDSLVQNLASTGQILKQLDVLTTVGSGSKDKSAQ